MSEDATDIIETKMESINKKLKFVDRLLKEVYEMLNWKTDNTGKGGGKPSGNSYEEKQKSYLEMLNNKRIREPKEQTLEYYQTKYDRESKIYVYLWNYFLNSSNEFNIIRTIFGKKIKIENFQFLFSNAK